MSVGKALVIKGPAWIMHVLTQTPPMQPERSDRYPDQPALNFTPSQFATSYAGSMSGTGGHRLNREDDDQSKASFYTSYAEAPDGDGLVKKEGNRVSFVSALRYSLKSPWEGFQYAERDVLVTDWWDLPSHTITYY
jgi:hypothetical protein